MQLCTFNIQHQNKLESIKLGIFMFEFKCCQLFIHTSTHTHTVYIWPEQLNFIDIRISNYFSLTKAPVDHFCLPSNWTQHLHKLMRRRRRRGKKIENISQASFESKYCNLCTIFQRHENRFDRCLPFFQYVVRLYADSTVHRLLATWKYAY